MSCEDCRSRNTKEVDGVDLCAPCLYVRQNPDDRDELTAIARIRWNAFEWGYINAYDSDPLERCSVVVPPGRANLVRVEHGEDLPGSWHQQANGGARHWSTASGEFDAR